MTGLYNVVEKLRDGEDLSENERRVHELAACGVLLDLHRELDHAVADCYGWPWPLGREEILQRVVALHDVRREEEAQGRVKWIRPSYQIPRFAPEEVVQQTTVLPDDGDQLERAAKKAKWPGQAIEQLAAVKSSLDEDPGTAQEVARRFHNARTQLVKRHLETLRLLAEVHQTPDDRYHPTGAAVETI